MELIDIENPRRTNGYSLTDIMCPCGGHMRIHSFLFGKSQESAIQKFYADCTCKECMNITEWNTDINTTVSSFKNFTCV